MHQRIVKHGKVARVNKSILTSLILALFAIGGLTSHSAAFALVTKMPSAVKSSSIQEIPASQMPSTKLHIEDNVSNTFERAPLSLHIGNRSHLFDGYFLCKAERYFSSTAGIVNFSD